MSTCWVVSLNTFSAFIGLQQCWSWLIHLLCHCVQRSGTGIKLQWTQEFLWTFPAKYFFVTTKLTSLVWEFIFPRTWTLMMWTTWEIVHFDLLTFYFAELKLWTDVLFRSEDDRKCNKLVRFMEAQIYSFLLFTLWTNHDDDNPLALDKLKIF